MHERKITASEKKAKAAKTQSRTKELTESDAPSVERFPGLLDDMPELAAEYLSLNAEGSKIEARKKEIREQFEEMLLSAGEPIVQGDFFVTEVVTSHKAKKLSPEKLLEHGVKMPVIEACYEGGEEFSYIKVSAKE